MKNEERIRDFRKGSLQWYPFEADKKVLFVGQKEDALFDVLKNKKLKIKNIDPFELNSEIISEEFFDYIVAVESLEIFPNYKELVFCLINSLTETGHLLLGVNNRLGTRYFFGDRDPYTHQNFDGIENYRRAYSKKEDEFLGRCYDKASVIELIQEMGGFYQAFSVFPDFSNVQMILRDDYKTKEDLSIRILPTFQHKQTVFLEENFIYNSLQKNDMLHAMANCILFDITKSKDVKCLDELQITSSMGRNEEDSFLTVIHENDKVEKLPVYEEGLKKLKNMEIISCELKNHGISVVEGWIEENSWKMSYMDEMVGQVYFEKIIQQDETKFLDELDKFINLILQSSDHISETDEDGVILKNAYPDMVPLNSFFVDGDFFFFDQEFSFDNYPANAIIIRVIQSLGLYINQYAKTFQINDLYKRYGLMNRFEHWNAMQWKFISDLRGEKDLYAYYTKHRYDGNQVYSNRLRMNYSSDEYLNRFVNIFHNLEYKKVILFGTGNYAKQFMQMYGKDYNVEAVIDNNISRQGEDLYGIHISSSDILKNYEMGTYRVIVCIKNFLSVTRQLDEMGVIDYGVFDPNQQYIRNNRGTKIAKNEIETKHKKYHKGYIAGVFDLFHVGHLEKFKLAKEQCDYLIVGLVSDEGVIKHKKTTPFVPFEERKTMLEACRYVDEVVEIPLDFGGSRDAWKMYGFDVQFSGSDYVDDPGWMGEKEFLNQHGVDIVFFPYTESTSSSKLKALIDEKLI